MTYIFTRSGGTTALMSVNPIPPPYLTTFSGGTENPISESNVWVNGGSVGLDWGNCAVNGSLGIAHGRHINVSFSDPTAILVGSWSPDQQGEGKYTGVGVTGCSQEVEIRLRSVVTAHVNRGYEILHSTTGSAGADYLQVVRWNGAIGDFDVLYNLGSGLTSVNNQTLRAKMVGDTITFWIIDTDGTSVVFTDSVSDTSVGGHAKWTDGNPGMGYWIGSSCLTTLTNEDKFGFTSYSAQNV